MFQILVCYIAVTYGDHLSDFRKDSPLLTDFELAVHVCPPFKILTVLYKGQQPFWREVPF